MYDQLHSPLTEMNFEKLDRTNITGHHTFMKVAAPYYNTMMMHYSAAIKGDGGGGLFNYF